MLKHLSHAGLAIALSLGAVSAFSIPASAQDLQLRIGPDGVRPVIRDRDRDRDYRRGGDCSPSEARAAARDEGFSRPQVVRVTDRSVTVQGYTQDGPDRITFANRSGCPAI
ncbi:hypothetical protein KX729_03280 [Rhizobium sp. XQZ8]|uniref:hypothetical protein n=1 Tax=Rhizobium populisoli TaxID=2859785 RepID=UPI001CA51E73|nr:hypothetical protein [Rhizobium populisoli]MBW6420451.1 hypothetical protein [Rhizobium populisoli]